MDSFLESLFENGELEIAARPSGADGNADAGTIETMLRRYESLWRMQQPFELPPLDISAALNGAKILEVACRAVVYREIEADRIEHLIQKTNLTPGDDPGQHYSIDLVLRFLPQVAERASRVSESDPLLESLRAVGQQWPLSSVGMQRCELQAIPAALRHASLWRMYIDRIISRRDTSRLNIACVREAVAAAIGPFQHLAPEFSGLG